MTMMNARALLFYLLLCANVAKSELQATCKVDAEGNCIDTTCDNKYPDCEKWASEGECKGKGIKFMLNFCREACKICDFQGNLTALILMKGDRELLDTPYGKIQTRVDTEHKDATNRIIDETIRYMEEEVFIDEQYATTRHICKNMDRSCAYWKAVGECENSETFMLGTCGPTCQVCHLLDYSTRCPSDPSVPLALSKADDLNKLFERITTDESFKQYEPTIVSMPNPPSADSPDEATCTMKDGIKDGPWIVTLDKFLTDEECDALVAVGAQEGYMDSIQFIRDKAGGGRTSKHTWCKGKCVENSEVAQRVDARIAELTGIPKENSEFLQLLKYDVGEFYRSHNDYNPSHLKVQTGVRILTVFLYLNDVEAGGETEFPNLGLAVTPKKGKVVIWPSVLNEDPNSQDDRTLHQALPVEEGQKFGANVWIHQRSYRDGYERGCTNA